MIGTLFAQEFRSTRKALFTSIGIALLVATVSFVTAALRVPLLGGLGLGVGLIAVILITPLALVLLAEHYWRTMYGRQGYFTMTLPVHGRQLFFAKVLYGLVTTAVALGITLLGLVAASVAVSLSQGHESFSLLRSLLDTLQAPMLWFIAGALALQFTFTVVAGAALMSIGAEGRFNHLGFGAPVIGGVITYFAMQILGLAAMLFVPFGLRIAGPDAGTFVAQGMLGEFMDSVFRTGDPAAGRSPAELAVTGPGGAYEPSVIGLGIVFVSIIATVLLAWWGARSVEHHTSLR